MTVSDLGEMLRKAREGRGLSPSDVRNDLRMQESVLLALEEGDYFRLPQPPYARGLLRLYAEYLGLDAEQALKLLNQEWPPQDLGGVKPVKGLPSKTTPWAAILTFLLLASFLALFFFRFYVQHRPFPIPITVASPSFGDAPASETQAASGIPGISPSYPEERLQALLPKEGLDSSPTATPIVPSMTTVSMEVRATERAWLRVVVDGREVFVGILQPGQVGAWTGRDTILLRTGNAGGTTVSINGVLQSSLGRSGEVVDRQWTVPLTRNT